MANQHNGIFKVISTQILEALTKAYPDYQIDENKIYENISEPPNLKMGHYAFACFLFAKDLKTSPVKVATEIKGNIGENKYIEEVILQGPYVNFKLKAAAFGELVLSEIISDHFFKKVLTKDTPKTMIEYSQPNTHKEMHVGHMRNLSLGNALVRIKRYCNQDVVSVTYPGDSGTHVAKCLWYLKFHNKENIPETAKGEWIGRMYSTANMLLEDQLGTDKEEENRAQLTKILKELHAGSGDFYDLWVETRQWSIDLMKKTYDWADVKFDRWFFESEMDAPSLDLAKKYYADGVFVKDDGAIGMSLEEEKLGFCLLIKRDGTGLYATKDVALAKQKFEEFKVLKNIYIVDTRQAFHFKQVFKVLEKIGFEQAKDCYHLPYEMVELTSGAMSSRKGNVVILSDLISQMQDHIATNYLAKYKDSWTKQEIANTAKDIASGAIKYGMVKMDNNRKIVFDMDEWLKLDGDTGPYLQYVYARINSLLSKQGYNKDLNPDYSFLKADSEFALMQKLSLFNDIIFKAHDQNKTNIVTTYLFELGKLFNSFYAECPIGSAQENTKNARLSLSSSTAKVMYKGLELLGIKAPERM